MDVDWASFLPAIAALGPYGVRFSDAISLVDGVFLSEAVRQAERRISLATTMCHGRSLGPLVKTRALRDDAL